jgi:hypothetical protein
MTLIRQKGDARANGQKSTKNQLSVSYLLRLGLCPLGEQANFALKAETNFVARLLPGSEFALAANTLAQRLTR